MNEVQSSSVLDHILAFLVPFFLAGTGGDPAAARHAALQLLEAHGATTDAQRLIAAEIVAFSLTTLANLAQSVADPALPISTCLRLRSNANALSRAAHRNRQKLDRTKSAGAHAPAEPIAKPTAEPPQPTTPPTAIQKIQDAIIEAAPALAQTLTNAGQTLSRQQRRFLQRKAEKAQLAQQREISKAARLAQRAPATSP